MQLKDELMERYLEDRSDETFLQLLSVISLDNACSFNMVEMGIVRKNQKRYIDTETKVKEMLSKLDGLNIIDGFKDGFETEYYFEFPAYESLLKEIEFKGK